MGTIFFHFANFLFFGQDFIIFLPKKKKKKDFAAARLATISATRYTGNKLFFKGGLSFLVLEIFGHCMPVQINLKEKVATGAKSLMITKISSSRPWRPAYGSCTCVCNITLSKA